MSDSNIWYVSSETYVTRRHVRSSSAFASESQAKRFARQELAAGKAVYAGTINPHTPKCFIPPEKVQSWLDTGESAVNEVAGTAVNGLRRNQPGGSPFNPYQCDT